VVFVFVLVDAVPCLVLLKKLVQSWSFYFCTLPDHIFAVIQQILVLFLLFEEAVIVAKLHDQSLAGACVEYIDHTGLDHFVKTYRVMPAIMEDL